VNILNNNIFAWISLATGLYVIMLVFAMNTKNFKSTLIFKIVPFFLGIGSIGVALKLFDIIALKM